MRKRKNQAAPRGGHSGIGVLGAAVLGLLLATAAAQALEPIEFTVSEYGKGLEKDLAAASLLLAAQRAGTTDSQDLLAAARADYGRLVAALYAQGFYAPVIHILIDGREAAGISPLDAPPAIGRITVAVNPGLPFVFGAARIAPLAPATRLTEGFVSGARARSGEITDSVQAAVDGWRDVGHAKAAVAGQDIVADHARQTLAVDVTITPGPRLRFGPLTVTGAARMKPGRIRAIAGLPEGEVFSPADLARSADRLRRSGVFRSVALAEDAAITAPDSLGITATVVEDKLHRYGVGAEVASFDGLTLTGYWLHRNLWGGAERLRVEGGASNIAAQSSGVDYNLGLTLDRPATFTPDTTLSFHLNAAHVDEADYLGDSGVIGLGFSHLFSDRLSARVGLDYNHSRVTDPSGRTIYRNLALPIGLGWDSRDVRLDATRGTFLEAEAMPFLGFGTTDSGARLTLDARAYRSFGERRPLTLAGRVQVGAVLGASLGGTPRDLLFYSGGGGTVRGQPYQSLGVTVLGDPGLEYQTGGMAFLAASAEVRARVSDRIGVVGFFDVGHVGAQDFFDAAGGWQSGAGLGLRYDTGFGPIRLDVALPVQGDTGAGVQIYVGLGQSF